MCGTSSGQASALGSDQAFQKMLTGNYATEFGTNQTLMKNLTSNLGGIIAAGPSQQGFSPAELAAKNSQAINSAAASNQKLQTVIGENGAKSGGAPGVESGVQQAERAQAATAVDTGLNNTEANITNENYDVGRQNYFNAANLQEKAPGAFEDPTNSAAGEVTGANNATAGQANQNAADSTGTELLGMTEGLGADASTIIGGALAGKCWIAAAVYNGWEDPRVDAARNFIFNTWAKESVVGSLVAKLYLAVGERVSRLVKKSSILRAMFKPLFDLAVRKNQE